MEHCHSRQVLDEEATAVFLLGLLVPDVVKVERTVLKLQSQAQIQCHFRLIHVPRELDVLAGLVADSEGVPGIEAVASPGQGRERRRERKCLSVCVCVCAVWFFSAS